ncbi:MAG: ATP-binding cassette domain-containing protein [Candidatus Micrarchaeota archaeon]|nr:ATP-binding cassette domain-containing protein [Candidatus Micrarchaeota archaeon]
MEEVISVDGLEKNFKTYESQSGKGIFLASLRRKYYTKKALRKVSFKVKKGEMVMLLGENGSGKSTLIKILTGIVHPDGGDAKVLGMTPWENRIKLAWNYGMVSGAHNQLFWNLPAIDTFEYIRGLYEIKQEDFDERLSYFINILNLEDVYRKQIRTLSLGERMKCNFVASVLHLPKVVFMDEATIGMDLSSVISLRQALLDMQKRHGTTFFMTTHIVDEIKALAEHVIIIDKGSIVFDGSKKELQRFFGKKKYLEVHFKNKIGKGEYPLGGKIVDQNDTYLKIEIDAARLKNKRTVALLNSENVFDYNVSEADIGHVLARFYGMRRKRR